MSTATDASATGDRPLRADARRNRERIVAAATELFVEEGVDVPLDAIAKRADVGIATLYRRFPDRDALAEAVALQTFGAVRALAEEASAPDAAPGGLQRFLHGIAELRVGVLMASLYPVLSRRAPDADLADAFDEMVGAATALTAHAHATGQLRPDVDADDVMLLLALLTRPLQGLPHRHTAAITPRLLHLLVEGLQPRPDATPPPPAPPRLEPHELGGAQEA